MIRSKLVSFAHAALLGAMALFASTVARADMCAADQRPGASLLIPYFEVDLAGTPGQGRNTRFWVRNTSTTTRLTNVTLWTTWGIPAFAFNVYLPAYGTHRIDLGELFLQGKLPKTGAGVTPVGAFDALGTAQTYASCNNGTTQGQPPVYTDLSAGAQNEIRSYFRGTVASGSCFGRNFGDDVARGYVTVDVVSQCSVSNYPTEGGYFIPGGFGVGVNENALLGGVEYVHPANNQAHSQAAYPLEAVTDLLVPGDISFYARYSGFIPADAREPLPFSWAFEFDSEANADADDADLTVFRAVPRTNPRACNNSNPPWFPLLAQEQVPFDRAGNTPPADPFPLGETQPQIGLATQTFPAEQLDVLLLDPLPTAGSGRINFTNFANGGGFFDGQAMLSVRHTWQGRFSEMQAGRALDSGCSANIAIPARVAGKVQANPAPPKYIFVDGFSS